jgi:hypothetical protein
MRTANTTILVVLAAINAGINSTLSAIFIERNATCPTASGNRCADRPASTCPVWGEYGYMAEPTRHGGECPNWDWSLSPRICAGNLIQDEGAQLPEYRTHRATLNWCILHQDFQLEFTTWGLPEFVELQREGRLYACDSDGLEGPASDWFVDFKLTRIGEEDAGPCKVAMRRGRMSHMGEHERRASRPSPDNSWKRHRSTQWR